MPEPAVVTFTDRLPDLAAPGSPGTMKKALLIAFAHGIYCSIIEWSVVWDILLERGYRVIAFDQRGHGQSTLGSEGICTEAMVGDCLAVLETYDVRGGILLAHSMGGFLAVAAVLEVPGVAERLCGLILMSTFAGDVLRGAPQNKAQIPLVSL